MVNRNKTGPKLQPLADRIIAKSMPEPNSGCWLWLGSLWGNGYGNLSNGSRQPRLGAHRGSWMAFRGPIAEGMDVCHRCDVPICVNPDHLFLGTRKDNMQDCKAKGRNIRGAALREAVLPHVHRGEIHYKTSLTEDDVRHIRANYSGATRAALATKYGMRPIAIWKIATRRNWTHVA